VWSAVDEKPKRRAGEDLARVRWLRARPQSTITVDRYDDDWTRLAWLQLLGRVDVVPVESAPEAIEALAGKYAPYAERTPPGPLLRLSIDGARQWRSTGSPRPDHSLHEPG